jgi:preprotein translocase subunit SecF
MEIFPPNSNFQFMRWRRASLVVTAVLGLVALLGLATRGLNFALDFTGGTVVELHFNEAPPLDPLRERLEQAGFDGAVVQTYGSANEVVVRTQPRKADVANEGGDTGLSAAQTTEAVLAAVTIEGNPATVVSSDFVGPQIGDELAYNGVVAALLVLVGFSIYITLRFEWKFAIVATATTFFDVFLVIGWFALLQREFDLTVLAGVLSVLGYSINDKIVVFDRVRESFRTLHKLSPEEVLNRSINNTLSRTVITSVVAFLTVLALYLYGGRSLEGMAESQMVGIILGTLSSIFIACPLLLALGVSKQDLLPKARDEAELARRP